MKTCKDCNITKSFDEFVPKPSCKDGYEVRCRSCRTLRYNKNTPDAAVRVIYNSQHTHSAGRGHPPPNYSIDDLKHWIDAQPHAAQLWAAYEASGFASEKKLSVDRRDPQKPYTLDNLQLMSWEENKAKGYREKRDGLHPSCVRPVMAIFLNGMPHRTYHSTIDAARDVKGQPWGITTVANGKPVKDGRGYLYQPKTYKGFIWKWV